MEKNYVLHTISRVKFNHDRYSRLVLKDNRLRDNYFYIYNISVDD